MKSERLHGQNFGWNGKTARNETPAIGIVLAGNYAADPLGVYHVRWSVHLTRIPDIINNADAMNALAKGEK